MKKTSIVFLVVSVLLIATGFYIKNKGFEQAEKAERKKEYFCR